MKCSRCALELPPGSAHVSADGCVEALKHALASATSCQECKEIVPVVAHAGCFVRIVQARAGSAGIGILERKAADWLKRQLSGEPRGERDEGPSPSSSDDEEPRGRGGRRFVP